MRTKIHRDGLMFEWISENHKIIVGFKRVKYGRCAKCGKKIPEGHNICDECFDKEKKISNK